jgi:hypothetical protein
MKKKFSQYLVISFCKNLVHKSFFFILVFAIVQSAALQTIGNRKLFFRKTKKGEKTTFQAQPNPHALSLLFLALQIDAFKLFFKKNIFFLSFGPLRFFGNLCACH